MIEILLFLVIILVPGFLIINSVEKSNLRLLEYLFLDLFSGLLLYAISSFTLLLFEEFEITNLIILESCLTLPFLYLFIKRKCPFRIKEKLDDLKQHFKEYIALTVLIIIALLWYQDHYDFSLLIRMDAGDYMYQAAYQSQHKSIYLTNVHTKAYKEFFPNAKFKMNPTNGFPAVDETHQEFPFPPLWRIVLTLAIILGGFKLAMLTSLMLGILATIAFHSTLSILFRKKFYILLGTSLFLLSPVLITLMRMTNSEAFMVYLLLSSISALYLANHHKSVPLAIIAGIGATGMILTRGDGLILYFGFALAVFVYSFSFSDLFIKRIFKSFGLAFFIVSIPVWFLNIYSNKGYLLLTSGQGFLNMIAELFIGSFVIFIVFLFIQKRVSNKDFLNFLNNKKLYQLVAIFFGLVCFFSFYIRPAMPHEIRTFLATWFYQWIAEPFGNPIVLDAFHSNTILLYATYLVCIFGSIGITVIIYKRNEKYLPFIIILSILSIYFLIILKYEGSYFGGSRRILYNILPLFIVGTLYILNRMEKKLFFGKLILYRSLIVLAFAVSLAGHNIYLTRDVTTYAKSYVWLDEFSTEFNKNQVLIFHIDSKEENDHRFNYSDALVFYLRQYKLLDATSPDFNTITDDEFIKLYKYIDTQKKELLFVIPRADYKKEVAERMKRIFQVDESVFFRHVSQVDDGDIRHTILKVKGVK